MNILYTLNDKFVPQVAAGVQSICENNADMDEISIYLISDGITEENKVKLKELGNNFGCSLFVIELGDLNKYFNFSFDTQGWNKVILARLLMGTLLPPDLNRVLYLDGDTIVRGSLQSLWKTDLSEKTIGMSIEPTANRRRKMELGLGNYPYHNSGVLLVDLKKWRERDCQNRIISFYREKQGMLFAADQDALNVVLKDEIYVLPPKYNYYNIFDYYSYSLCTKLMKPVDYTRYVSAEDFENARQHPVIIHYLGEERPWRSGNKHRFRDEYLGSLSKTVWSGQGMETGWETYFKFWNLFNVVFRHFPLCRYKIIDQLIPVFMKIRKKNLKKSEQKKKL